MKKERITTLRRILKRNPGILEGLTPIERKIATELVKMNTKNTQNHVI